MAPAQVSELDPAEVVAQVEAEEAAEPLADKPCPYIRSRSAAGRLARVAVVAVAMLLVEVEAVALALALAEAE